MRLAWHGWAKDNIQDLKPDTGKRWKGKARVKAKEMDANSVDQPPFAAVTLDFPPPHTLDGLEQIPAKEEDNIIVPAEAAHHPIPLHTPLPLDIVLDPSLILDTRNPAMAVNAAPTTEETPVSDVVFPDNGSLTCATQPGARVLDGIQVLDEDPAKRSHDQVAIDSKRLTISPSAESSKRRKISEALGMEQTSNSPALTGPSRPSTMAFSSAVFKPLHHTPLLTSVAGTSTAHGDASSPPTKVSHMLKQPKETKPKVSAVDLPIYPRENNVTGRELQLREWLDGQEVGATKAQFNAYFGTVTKEVTKVYNKRASELKAQGVKCLGEWLHPQYK